MVCFTPQQAAFALELLSQLAGIPATIVQKSPLKHWDHLLKPNIERNWKHREEGQGEGMCDCFLGQNALTSSPLPLLHSLQSSLH